MKIPWPKLIREHLDDEAMPPLPETAIVRLPHPVPTNTALTISNKLDKPINVVQSMGDTVNDEQKLAILAKAHEITEMIKAERDADKAQIGKLQAELTEALLMIDAERRKISALEDAQKRKVSALELDLLTAANNTQALATQVQDMRQLLSLFRHAMDRWEIKAPPKQKRNGKKKPVLEGSAELKSAPEKEPEKEPKNGSQ